MRREIIQSAPFGLRQRRPDKRGNRSATPSPPRQSQTSAATMLLGLLCEGRLRSRGVLRLSGIARLVLGPLFLLEARLPAKSRSALAVRLAVLLRSIVLTDAAIGADRFPPGRL